MNLSWLAGFGGSQKILDFIGISLSFSQFPNIWQGGMKVIYTGERLGVDYDFNVTYLRINHSLSRNLTGIA
jgi:hypothetical protein